MYLTVKTLHTAFACLTISGFLVRGFWMLRGSPLLRHRMTRIAPHVIDTLFLASGIALIVEINLPILHSGWLLAKLVGLVAYIGLGMVALRFGRTLKTRSAAFVAAVAVFAYIAGVALAKSPASWFAYVSA